MKAKIIIVEDHEPIRNELKILLSKYGYEIIVLDRFDTVVEDCLREDVDLILLDINLPFYDGYYVCRAIREKSEVPTEERRVRKECIQFRITIKIVMIDRFPTVFPSSNSPWRITWIKIDVSFIIFR